MTWRRWRSLLLPLGDALILNAAFVVVFLVRYGSQLSAYNFSPYANYFWLYTLLYLLLLALFGAYEPEPKFSWLDHMLVLVPAVGTFILIQLMFLFVLREFGFPRLVLTLSYLLVWGLSSILHAADSSILRRTEPPHQLLLIGEARDLQALLAQKEKLGKAQIVGAIGLPGMERIAELPIYHGAPLAQLVKQAAASELLVLSSPQLASQMMSVLLEAREGGIPVFMIPSLYDMLTAPQAFDRTGDLPMVTIWRGRVRWIERFAKRGLDLAASFLLLGILAPLLLLAAAGVRLTSYGPILLRQERIGLGGSTFTVTKFRTMRQDAESESGPVFAQENDPRITPFGRILRLLRVDELPQLWQVLGGEMSLVGPRPERPLFVEQFQQQIPGYGLRFLVKPGMTGMAQIYGSYETTPENKLRYDLAYIRGQSFRLDLRLLFLTFKLMLGRKGAR
jgi:exopolysaccharide biosynthesis polyprenyl glycosylphosphotransferase